MLTFNLIVAAASLLFNRPAREVSAAEAYERYSALAAEYEKATGEKLNWQESIVDRLKILGCSHDLFARQSLAADLGYQGKLDGSADMNLWLMKEVDRKFAAGEIG